MNIEAYKSVVDIILAENKSHNILFMHGKTGTGKTHLLISLTKSLVKLELGNTVYVTANDFFYDYINSIRNNTLDSFKINYQNIDYLLFDDVDSLGGKEQTQDEFLRLFNRMHNAGKIIVIAGNFKPQADEKLHERILSRLTWGKVIEIKNNYEV